MDLFTFNNGTSSVPLNDLLYENVYQNAGNYIGVKLSGGCQSTNIIGSRITVKAGGRTFTREICGGEGYHSESMLWKCVGIGSASIVDSLIVKWPKGNTTRLSNVTPNRYIKVNYLENDEAVKEKTVQSYKLMSNYPIPFNPSTVIAFEIPVTSLTSLRVYDILGQEVATLVNSILPAGQHEAVFNAQNLSSGVYYYKLVSGSFTETRQMILVK